MKVLIVEDILFRKNYLSNLIPTRDIDWAQHADDGLAFLEENKYDLVFLDHDLLSAKSGSHLTLEWVERKEAFKTKKPLVIIHSMNMEGATKMGNHLKGIFKPKWAIYLLTHFSTTLPHQQISKSAHQPFSTTTNFCTNRSPSSSTKVNECSPDDGASSK